MSVFDLSSVSGITPFVRIVPADNVLWRIHSTRGPHPMLWNGLRTFGPLATARWDPHPEPAADYAPLGAAYLGFDVLTCLAEVYQAGRFVDVETNVPYLSAWQPRRALKVLDLSTEWFVSLGGTSATALGPTTETRRWARFLKAAWPDVDGLLSASAVVPGREVLVLWTADVFPASPVISEPLDNPALSKDLHALARRLGFSTNA